jgi:excinuclease ABC subunit A
VNVDLVLGDPSISILEGALPWESPRDISRKVVLPTLAKAFKFDLAAPWRAHSEAARQAAARRSGRKIKHTIEAGRSRDDYESEWEGILVNVARRYRESTSDSVRVQLEEYMIEQPCGACKGRRLKPESLSVLVAGKGIGEVVELSIVQALEFFQGLPIKSGLGSQGLDSEVAGPILKKSATGFDSARRGARLPHPHRSAEPFRRRSPADPAGTQIGSRLVGVLYILDEPSIGLHQRDNERLLSTLRELGLGNTVIVVEHDEDTIRRPII